MSRIGYPKFQTIWPSFEAMPGGSAPPVGPEPCRCRACMLPATRWVLVRWERETDRRRDDPNDLVPCCDHHAAQAITRFQSWRGAIAEKDFLAEREARIQADKDGARD